MTSLGLRRGEVLVLLLTVVWVPVLVLIGLRFPVSVLLLGQRLVHSGWTNQGRQEDRTKVREHAAA